MLNNAFKKKREEPVFSCCALTVLCPAWDPRPLRPTPLPAPPSALAAPLAFLKGRAAGPRPRDRLGPGVTPGPPDALGWEACEAAEPTCAGPQPLP